MVPKTLLILATAIFSRLHIINANPVTHSSAGSLYIHSNDSFSLQLSDAGTPYKLQGRPGEIKNLDFFLHNHEPRLNQFVLKQSSEDGFTGTLSEYSVNLNGNSNKMIRVSGLRVPQKSNGERILFALTAQKMELSRKKREDAPWLTSTRRPGGFGGSDYNQGGYNPGGGNYNPGGSNYNPGGSNYNPGGGNYNPGGGNFNQGGNYNPGGGNYNPGGSNYNPGGGNFNNGGYPNFNDPYHRDPSNKREVTVTVEFEITDDPQDDDSEPDIFDVAYAAQSDEELCSPSPDSGGCNPNEWWQCTFKIMDEESGLDGNVRVSAKGKDTYKQSVYYRYVNYNVGTRYEQEVHAYGSCCTREMEIKVSDVAGNVATRVCEWDGTGSDNVPIWIIIVAVVGGILLIAAIVALVFVLRRKYSPVSSDGS